MLCSINTECVDFLEPRRGLTVLLDFGEAVSPSEARSSWLFFKPAPAAGDACTVLSLFLSVDVAVPRREAEAGFDRRVEEGFGLETVGAERVGTGLLMEVRDVAGLVAPPLNVEVVDVLLAVS